MVYAVKYETAFKDISSGRDVIVFIYEGDYTGIITPLLCADQPLVVNFNDADENYTNPIMSINATLNLVIREGAGDPTLEDFISTDTKKYKIEVIYDDTTASQIWFTGFLLAQESSELWINANRVLSLNITDGLAPLKDRKLLQADGSTFDKLSRYRIFEFIKGCLWLAQPDTEIRTFDNLFADGEPDRTFSAEIDPLYYTYLDARTFMKNQKDFEDPYTVLSKILAARGLQVSMHDGYWLIAPIIHLIPYNNLPGTRYQPNGTISAITDSIWDAAAGRTYEYEPVENFIEKSYEEPVLKNRVTYKFERFPMMICNESLTEGSSTSLDCWAYEKGMYASPTPGLYNYGLAEEINTDGVTIDRFAYIDYDGANESWLKSEPTLVDEKCKLTIYFQMRLNENPSPSGNETLNVVGVYLSANDGTYYTLDDDGLWYLSNSTFTVNHKRLKWSYTTGEDRQQWISYTLQSGRVPKTGTITIRLFESASYSAGDQKTFWKGLSLTYTPVILDRPGSQSQITGDYNEIDLTAVFGYVKESEYESFLSDSPGVALKGCYIRSDGVTPTKEWSFNGAGISIPPGPKYPMKKWLAIMYYWLTKRYMLSVKATLYGLQFPAASGKQKILMPANRITLVSGNVDKRFLPVRITNIDVNAGTWDVDMVEVKDDTDTETWPDFAGVHRYDLLTSDETKKPGRIAIRWWDNK